MTLTGTARYPLYASAYGSGCTDLRVTVVVEYDVVVGWDPESRAPTLENATPSDVVLIVGDNEMESMSWGEVVGGLAYYIRSQDVSTWESLGLKEDDAREALSEEAEDEAFYQDHRAGVA